MDLFSYRDSYPNSPGWQKTDTSYAAAKDIESATARLQRRALAAIKAAGEDGLHMEEVSEAVGEHRHSIQPRCSELRAKGLIRDTGVRRKLASGKNGICWVATT